jgi:hypothetical protein
MTFRRKAPGSGSSAGTLERSSIAGNGASTAAGDARVDLAAEGHGGSREARLTACGAVSDSLARRSDRELGELVDAATVLGRGIGGESAALTVDGIPVFVKLVPLTALEALPGQAGSTANAFALPAFCHYGIGTIGSPGFGVWRELAVHAMTTSWVIAGDHEGFPLIYHWRVLPDRAPALSAELADVEKAVAYWGGRAEVRSRIEALQSARASVALFLEYFPQNLHEWLGAQLQAGGPAADRACAMVERQLEAGTDFMNARGLIHFDAHFENILTDGQRLYFTDYGLALSSRFGLSGDEAAFFERHRTYDRCYTRTYLVHWLVTALHGARGDERDALIQAYADGGQPAAIPAAAAAALARHAPLTVAMASFYREFQRGSRETPYPVER